MPDTDDPFKPSDATVLRPRPGAGRRGAGELPPQPRAVAATPFPDEIASSRALLGVGLNPLVQAASPLLLLAGHLRGTLSVPDIVALRRHTLEEIRQFEERARAAGVAHEVLLAARYALCAGLDEAVLSTPWGAQSEWAAQTLLVALHREAWGGEKFFEMLDRIATDPGRHLDLMELQYLCVALGFKGKYHIEGGEARLAEVQRGLYRTIRTQRGVPQPELSLRWQGVQDTRNRLIRYVPWWVVGAAALAVLAATFSIYYYLLERAADPVHAALTNIGTEAFAARPAAPPPVGLSLKQLLAPDDGRGGLTVEEQGNRTLITLQAPDLFASGSATPNPAYEAMLGRVSSALNQVPGRVLVQGHTDDQPLRSLQYRDNFDLSRERAVSVVRLLQRGTAPARFEWNGRGSSEPSHVPASTPENRALNRRVEIIHVRE